MFKQAKFKSKEVVVKECILAVGNGFREERFKRRHKQRNELTSVTRS